ncbi:hypothetical protein LTR37_004520 [Vermiconidia calcicola]|uniref:Uncharacterized protein n=1 Tax=Vermiconidia calcicola TaxID=1690605 RepID=A0ACC3NPT8_9PEZI|nr:hypothetical protein LTR37_004520 [Vermiconidia calcicola]
MRHAYSHDTSSERKHSSGTGSDRSYHSGSEKSYQTPPTSYSSSPSQRPPHIHYSSCDTRHEDVLQRYFDDRHTQESPRSSVGTYASTVQSEEELPEDMPEYDVPRSPVQPYAQSAIAATPSDFSELFPSKRRLMVRHDDSTLDGNMNLRVDTEVSIQGRDCDMTLFHLRMHDLKNRDFSLRRYCRDSGREVCHSIRKHQKPAAEKRPGFHRSLSNALQSMRPKSESRSISSPNSASLKRNDSGYASLHSVDVNDDDRPTSASDGTDPQDTPTTNSVKLEFSNYAQLDVKRTGLKGNKRYEFEYWGVKYSWTPVTRKDRGNKQISYHLTKAGSEKVLAYITPVPMTVLQAQEEQNRGGWIPQCTMWIADEQIIRSQKDTSDVVIASGLMALVDDSIRHHFHAKDTKQMLIPVPKLSMGVEYVGPKRLINEMFNRKESGSSQQSRPSTSSGPTSSGFSTTGRRPSGSVRQCSYGP